jgi:hypothetical protein
MYDCKFDFLKYMNDNVLFIYFQANPHIHRVRCVFNANHLTTPRDLLAHMSTCPDAINTSTVLIGLSDIRKLLFMIRNRLNKKRKFIFLAPGRPWSDNCHRSSVPTDRQMFLDVTATEDWDGKNYDFVLFSYNFYI